MKHQEQMQKETLESQLPPCTEERQDKNTIIQSYCPPQVCLVGNAKHLMTGYESGENYDDSGYYYS